MFVKLRLPGKEPARRTQPIKKLIIIIPTIAVVISLAVFSFIFYNTQSQANIGVSGDICATVDNSSSFDRPQIGIITYHDTGESVVERVVFEFTG